MVQEFGGKAKFVAENYGESRLAMRHGVTRYPAIFVNDVLVATPKDFGFYGRGEGEENGRYAPLRSEASHERFRADLTRMISLILEGKPGAARAEARPSKAAEITEMPGFTLTDLAGEPLSRESLAGRPVVVEFWATWCPPCRAETPDIQEVYEGHESDGLVVLAISIGERPSTVAGYVERTGTTFTVAVDQSTSVAAQYRIVGIPTHFFVDRDGVLREWRIGSMSKKTMEKKVNEILAPAAAGAER